MATCPMPWFPLYALEMLGDGDFISWSLEERGCWITLSARCWADGSIPEDTERMAKLCGCDAQAMLKHWAGIASKFEKSEIPGRLISRRIEEERQKAIEKAEKICGRAKAGAAARWMKEKEEMPKQCLSTTQAMLGDATSPSPLPIPKDKDKKNTSPAAPPPSGKRSEVISIWNETTDGKLAKAKVTTKRFGIIAARMAEPGWLEDFKAACAYLVSTPFYLGQNDRGWTADLDWVLKPGKATELAEKAAAPKNGVSRGPVVQFRAQEAQDSFIAQLSASGMEDF